MYQMAIVGKSAVQIAEWLNESGVKPGRYTQLQQWSSKTVGNLLRDRLLYGLRRFGKQKSRWLLNAGKYRIEKNPNPDEDYRPELAHITEEQFDKLQDALDRRKRGGQKTGKENPLYGKPRSRTKWPGQTASCSVCGERMHSDGRHLRCKDSAVQYGSKCWNHVKAKNEVVVNEVIPWLTSLIRENPEFLQEAISACWVEYQREIDGLGAEAKKISKQMASLERELKNLTQAIRLADTSGKSLPTLLDAVEVTQNQLSDLKTWKEENTLVVSQRRYASIGAVSAHFDNAFLELARTSLDFAEVLRDLMPTFEIFPVKALDSNQVRPMGEVVASIPCGPDLSDRQEFRKRFYLFQPSKPIQLLDSIKEMRMEHPDWSRCQIMKAVGERKSTVERSIFILKVMEKEGLSVPFRRLHCKPEKASRLYREETRAAEKRKRTS
ncbi:Recombinase [Stratiformator vulcanicus]|uniref:Recombinase n=2 Tax=Stratiformator vulcanicus TaxID=2527980 RepID=A0A517QWA6_9PLAN|nr:Recombinase [Stratiformator vulcanicus]